MPDIDEALRYLGVGGEAPEEIAVAILAELLMIRYGKRREEL